MLGCNISHVIYFILFLKIFNRLSQEYTLLHNRYISALDHCFIHRNAIISRVYIIRFIVILCSYNLHYILYLHYYRHLE